MKTRLATQQDVPQILKILQEKLIDISNPNVLQKQHQGGFLIKNLGFDDFCQLITDRENNLVLVAENEDEILGYLIASKMSSVAPDLQSGIVPVLQQNQIVEFDKIFYHRQIAVKNGVKKVGSALLLQLVNLAKQNNYKYIACRIVHQPIYNQKSVIFHQKFGFKQIGDDVKDGLVAGVYGVWL
jgi:L-amino acid N-acyltransferase YncA